MKVAELIEKLKQVPEELDVWVSDGYEGNDYHGNFTVEVLEGADKHKYCEIEVGGLLIN